MDKEQIDSIQKQIFDEYLKINDFDTSKNDIYHTLLLKVLMELFQTKRYGFLIYII